MIKIETERDVEMWRLGRLMRAVIKIGMSAELGEIMTDFKHKFASVYFCDKKLHSCSMWRSGWHIYEMKNDENNQDTQRTWVTNRWASFHCLLFHVAIRVASDMKNDVNNQKMPKEMIAEMGEVLRLSPQDMTEDIHEHV